MTPTPTETKALVDRLRALDLYLNNLWSRAATLRDKHTGQAHADLNELRHAIGAIDDVLIPAAQALEPLTREPDADEVERVARAEKERAYAVRWANRSVDSVKAVMWRYEDALKKIESGLECNGAAHYCPNCDRSMDGLRQIARAALSEEPGHGA